MKPISFSGSVPALLLAAVALASCNDHPFAAAETEEIIRNEGSSNTAAASVTMQGSRVYWFDDLSEATGASASLVRNRSGLRIRIHTSDLPPRDAVTIWWVVFNYPHNCSNPVEDFMECSEPDLFNEDVAPSVLYAAGNVVGGSGLGNFAASLGLQDLRGCQPPFEAFGLCGEGLQNPEGAEVHVVVRSHGPTVPGMVSDQIKTFAGGCTPESSLGAGPGPNECKDLQFSVFSAP